MEWRKAGKGLQYREHETRKYGVRFDRYVRGRYKIDGKLTTVSFAWESEWTAGEKARMDAQGETGPRKSFLDHCRGELFMLKENARRGEGP